MTQLPVLESCAGCCACCRRTPIPPFEPGEDVAKDVPAEFLSVVRLRIEAGQEFELLPCVWLNAETGLCNHYDYRPDACRRFEIGSDLCRLSRWDEGFEN